MTRTAAKPASRSLYQIKVTLAGSQPPVWRRLLVPGSMSLQELHHVLQTAMGWTDSHLHQFEARGRTYGVPDPESDGNTINEARVRLAEALRREGDAMTYEYDFGDGWNHEVVLEKILKSAGGATVPSCIGGARACPPEDCGGVPGYEELLQALRDVSHPRHREMLDWLGRRFEPERFDSAETSRLLRRRRRSA